MGRWYRTAPAPRAFFSVDCSGPPNIPATPTLSFTQQVDVRNLTGTSDATITLTVSGCNDLNPDGDSSYIQASLSYSATPVYVVLNINTDPALPNPVEDPNPVSPGQPVTADLALGTVFGIGLIEKVPDPSGIATDVPITSTYSISGDQINPPLETDFNLFDSSTVVSLSSGDTSGESLEYVAVHLGQLTFTLQPTSVTGLQPVQVVLNIVKPSALGSDFNQFDEEIIEAAHERGIPPQIIKGQAQQESDDGYTLQADDYRYEPCTVDMTIISGGPRLIGTPPYSLYALDGVLGNPSLAPVVNLRDQLSILDAALNPEHLMPGDRGITAAQIWYGSDRYEHWSDSCPPYHAYLVRPSGPLVPEPWVDMNLGFLAQTVTAASYGILQVLYSTAVGPPYRWSVPDPAGGGQTQSPLYLLDTDRALMVKHGGSVFIGSEEDVYRYRRANGNISPAFSSADDFFDTFKEPLRMYTGGGIHDYGTKVIDKYQYNWTPADPNPIFH